MKEIGIVLIFSLYIVGTSSCQKQITYDDAKASTGSQVGGAFQNGDYIYIDQPSEINSVDTSPGWTQSGQRLFITGTIYEQDGVTPAPNVLIYYYHTNIEGIYDTSLIQHSEAKKHGYIRGWVKSDEHGRYSLYTVRPAPYPENNEPAHIHITIKEPNDINEYYIDSFIFDDDLMVTAKYRRSLEKRGGSGLLRLLKDDDLLVAEHNIILGLNIPNYPSDFKDDLEGNSKDNMDSGPAIGEDVHSFTPQHVWGPDRGKQSCPVCKYGRYNGLLYFVGRHPNWQDIRSWLLFFENESHKRAKRLKVYFIYGNDRLSTKKFETKLEQLGTELGISEVALTYVPSFIDQSTEIIFNKINPDVINTMLIYRHNNIIGKYVNLLYNEENRGLIESALNQGTGDFFHLKTIYETKE